MEAHEPRPRFWRNEDWLAVGLGALILVALCAGLRPGLPKLSWATAAEAKDSAKAIPTLGDVFAPANLGKAAVWGLILLALSAIGVRVMGGNLVRYAPGFAAVFLLAFLAQVAAENATVKYWGLEYVLFALALGLLVSNTVGVPAWLREAVKTEYFIKTGLVILGSGVLFHEILRAGGRGVLQALGVVFVVWYACYWLAKRLRVDEELAVMLSTAVSICGVSAAIAACGAIRGDRKKLSYVTSLVLIVAAPMMVLMPWAVKAFGIPDEVGGAWIGGTLDTTGSVTAAAALVSDAAMKTGVVVKFSQNVLIGVAAFLLSLWWTVRKGREGGERPSPAVIWERFPKFVLGFLAASAAFTLLVKLSPDLVAGTKGVRDGVRNFWFALAFVSIGLETRFAELFKMGGGRPAAAFLGAQAFNVAWTLLLAFLLFRP